MKEVNFDGLVGPTHHYGGHAYGNLASIKHQASLSNPKKAALQGLHKMKRLHDLGLIQAVLPPRMRPAFHTLRSLGFSGTDTEIHAQVAKKSPQLLYALSSASSMWAANCATVSPSSDTSDGRVHITIANLQSKFHRALEAYETYQLFQFLFSDKSLFTIHPPLPSGGDFGDEGAANHTRFCSEYGSKGTHLFVYGKSAFQRLNTQFPFRQAKEASEAVARQHGLNPKQTLFVQQNPEVINRGVFHNDVISVGNQTTFLYHEKAFIQTTESIQMLQERCPLNPICVTDEMLPVEQAINTYLFNSQLLTLPGGKTLLLAPKECEPLDLSWLPFDYECIELRESMQNGGGPACLRLRVVLNQEELKSIHPNIFLSDSLYAQLVTWIETYYRDRLSLEDLKDPSFLLEVREALDTLSQILNLNSFYSDLLI